MAMDGIGTARNAEQGHDRQRTWIALGSLAGLTAVALVTMAAHRLAEPLTLGPTSD
jgi:hypothetical protein